MYSVNVQYKASTYATIVNTGRHTTVVRWSDLVHALSAPAHLMKRSFLMTMAIQEIGEENLSFLSETKSLIFLLYCRIILKTNYFGKAKLCIIGLTRNKSS